MLDTNVYCLFFNAIKTAPFINLESKMKKDGLYSFYISEITSLEIYSVIGKMQRGTQQQVQKCGKMFQNDGAAIACENTWITEGQKKLSKNQFRDISKLLHDIENQRSFIQATVLGLTTLSILKGKQYLRKYSHKYKFGSQDAMIVGTLLQAKEEGNDLILVTSDRSLIAALAEDGVISYFDPTRNSLFISPSKEINDDSEKDAG